MDCTKSGANGVELGRTLLGYENRTIPRLFLNATGSVTHRSYEVLCSAIRARMR
jgi:hypothetical protein